MLLPDKNDPHRAVAGFQMPGERNQIFRLSGALDGIDSLLNAFHDRRIGLCFLLRSMRPIRHRTSMQLRWGATSSPLHMTLS